MSQTKVLIVEDSRVTREMLVSIVSDYRPDWKILVARNGHEALQWSEDNHFDYILSDVNMPGLDGVALTHKLMLAQPQAKISLVTAYHTDRVKRHAEANELLMVKKPFTPEEILPLLDASSAPAEELDVDLF